MLYYSRVKLTENCIGKARNTLKNAIIYKTAVVIKKLLGFSNTKEWKDFA
jgi:hypothetical protein